MKMIIKENIKLLNRYMNDRTYLRLDQNRNDRIRNSLSWKITQPIRAIGKYKYFLNKKVNYCYDYKKWISEFPQFNENDKDIFENFQNNYKESIVVILIVDHIYIDSILETLKTISQQNIFVDTVFIISKHKISHPAKEKIHKISEYFNFNVSVDKIKIKDNKKIYISYGTSKLHDNYFSVHILCANNDTIISYSDDEYVFDDGSIKPAFKPKFSLELLNHVDYLKGGIFVHNAIFFKENMLEELYKTFSIRETVISISQKISQYNTLHIPFLLNSVPAEKNNHSYNYKLIENCEINKNTISIIIPTKNNYKYIRRCVKSILEKTEYPLNLIEFVIINNGSESGVPEKFFRKLQKKVNIKILEYKEKFNYSLINNLGFSESSGDIVVFLNDDTKLLDGSWIAQIQRLLCEKDVGVVGCKLLYGNGRVQHNGCVVGGQNFAQHAGLGLKAQDPGYMGLMNASREVLAVTGACMALRRDVFSHINGFDENLEIAFNDILLCIRSKEHGYRNIVISNPLFVHYESISRGLDLTSDKINIYRSELEYIKEKSQYYKLSDPYYNDNLSFSQLYQLSSPPRRKKIWRHGKYDKKNKKNVIIIHDKDNKINYLKEIFEDNFNIKLIYMKTCNIKNNDIMKISKDIVKYDTDYVLLYSYEFLDLSYILGNFCKILFFSNFSINDDRLFFDLSGHTYNIVEGNFEMYVSSEN